MYRIKLKSPKGEEYFLKHGKLVSEYDTEDKALNAMIFVLDMIQERGVFKDIRGTTAEIEEFKF